MPRTSEKDKDKQAKVSAQDDKSKLFNEINALRKGGADIDQDQLDRDKLNNSCAGKIAASKKFEYITLSIIVLNAGFIGYDADFSARKHKPDNLYSCEYTVYNSTDSTSMGTFVLPPADCYQFGIAENIFCIYFTFEVVTRLLAYKKKSMALSDAWFIFDGSLVAFMVVETWILPFAGGAGSSPIPFSVLRLLRLLRITRMAKLMRFFPELQIIVKGMIAAVRSVLCTAILLLLILYVWAILFTSEFHQGDLPEEDVAGTARQFFGSMGKSMRHLFIMGTILDDITLCCNYIRGSNKGPTMLTFFIIFVLISSFTMLNMLIGILCEVVCAVGEGERNKNTEAKVREAIGNLFHQMDRDGSGEISRDEFLSMKGDKNVMKALHELEVKAKHFEMYADLMFKPDTDGNIPTFDFEKTLNIILRLRPEQKVSALDFASFSMTVGNNQTKLQNHISSIEQITSMLTGKEMFVDGETQNPEEPAESSLPELGTTSDADILAELQRRLEKMNDDEGQEFEPYVGSSKRLSAPGLLGQAWVGHPVAPGGEHKH